ncbi:MAG: hypothetical protein V9F82_07545 [Dermatophilaceae bacterium]
MRKQGEGDQGVAERGGVCGDGERDAVTPNPVRWKITEARRSDSSGLGVLYRLLYLPDCRARHLRQLKQPVQVVTRDHVISPLSKFHLQQFTSSFSCFVKKQYNNMQTSSIPLLFGICFFFTTQPYVFAQNLLANPDFEDENICTEFIARCAPEAWLEVNYGRIFYLQNDKGSKVAIRLSNDPGMRTFLFTELLCPLIAGETYRISFDLNLREAEFRSFGIFLSRKT